MARTGGKSPSPTLPRKPGRTETPSVIIARHAERLGDALILHSRLEHHAVGELVDHRTLDLLPGRLALRSLETATVLEGEATLCQFLLRDQHIGSTLVEVDANAVAGAQQRQAAARRRLRRRVED